MKITKAMIKKAKTEYNLNAKIICRRVIVTPTRLKNPNIKRLLENNIIQIEKLDEYDDVFGPTETGGRELLARQKLLDETIL